MKELNKRYRLSLQTFGNTIIQRLLNEVKNYSVDSLRFSNMNAPAKGPSLDRRSPTSTITVLAKLPPVSANIAQDKSGHRLVSASGL